VAVAEPTTERIEAAILALLAERAPGRTICPSEAARVLAGDDDFRPLMDAVRAQAWAMAARGELEITQRGLPVQPDGLRGPIRLRRPTGRARGRVSRQGRGY
jgi:hypothetical protein